VNNSPFCGREGKYVTSRQIRERFDARDHAQRGVAGRRYRYPDKFVVFGAVNTSRRVVGKHAPRRLRTRRISSTAVVKEVDGQPCEPYETLAIDLDENRRAR